MIYNYFKGLQDVVILFVDIIIATNAFVIIYLEKDQFREILKLKVPN